jgi:polar amino acid transport system substrate-binding protein
MTYSRQTDDEVVLRTQAGFEQLQADGAVADQMAGPH